MISPPPAPNINATHSTTTISVFTIFPSLPVRAGRLLSATKRNALRPMNASPGAIMVFHAPAELLFRAKNRIMAKLAKATITIYPSVPAAAPRA